MSKNHNCKNCISTSQFGWNQNLDELEFERSIFNSCVNGELDKVKKFVINDRESVNRQDKNGYSPLHYASRNNNIDICKYLLENGANVHLKTKSCTSTALHRASYMGNFEIVKLLLEYGSNIFEKDCDSKTPFHKSLDQFILTKDPKFEKILKLFIEKDSRIINEKDKFNNSALQSNLEIKSWIKN